jgi:hypothetical protein
MNARYEGIEFLSEFLPRKATMKATAVEILKQLDDAIDLLEAARAYDESAADSARWETAKKAMTDLFVHVSRRGLRG